MNPDAIVLALLAIADLAFIVHLRRRHARRIRMDRMMASLRWAVYREIVDEELPAPHPLLPAS